MCERTNEFYWKEKNMKQSVLKIKDFEANCLELPIPAVPVSFQQDHPC